jgi:iron complex transport system ATP-binding protein
MAAPYQACIRSAHAFNLESSTDMSDIPLIEFEHVFVMRGATVALNNVSLRIGVGEQVAILGPNGCGKSTLVKAITRECYPLIRKGSRVRILGRDRWNVFELRISLGIVSNDLMSACTRAVSGREIVISGFFSSIGVLDQQEVTADMHESADRALRLLDALHLAQRSTNEMSSGEARRVLLARALVHSPRALILDEPSIGLDLAAQHELRLILRKLAQSGIGIVMVTHHLSDFIPEIQRVLLMDRGSIVADGPTPEILNVSRLSAYSDAPGTLRARRVLQPLVKLGRITDSSG